MKPWWDADPFSRCIWEPLPFQTHPCSSMLSKWLSLERNSLLKSSCLFLLVNNLFVSCSWQLPSKEKLLLWEFGLLIQYYILLCWIVCESFHCWSSTSLHHLSEDIVLYLLDPEHYSAMNLKIHILANSNHICKSLVLTCMWLWSFHVRHQ